MKKTVKYVQFGAHSYKVTEWQWKGPAGSIITSRSSEKLITINDIIKEKK